MLRTKIFEDGSRLAQFELQDFLRNKCIAAADIVSISLAACGIDGDTKILLVWDDKT